MGLSTSKSKTTTDAKTTEQGTTTPTNLPGLDQTFLDWTDRIGAFGNMDPNQFVAPASPLQRMAWDNAGSMADWQPQARLGAQAVHMAGNAAPANAGPAKAWNPSQGTASSYQAPNIGQAALVSARGYQAPNLGDAHGYAAARVGQPIRADTATYATQPTGRTAIDPTVNGQAYNATAGSLLDNLGSYRNPYNDSVRTLALQDYDMDAERTRARQMADAAKSGAFGGSRFGLAQAQTEDNLSRARASLDAGLLSEGFDRATALSGQDAGRRQETSLFNAGNQTAVSSQNAAAENARRMAQAGLSQQSNLSDADAVNRSREFGAGAYNTQSMFNAGQDMQTKLAQAGLDTDAAKYGAGINNDFALQRAQMGERAGQFNATLGSQADLANQAMQGQYGLADFAAQERAAATNAQNQQQMGLANLGYQNQAGQYGAQAGDEMSRFNAGLQDAQTGRQLQSGMALGDMASQYGAGVRDDLGMMAQLGDQQRGIEQQYGMAPLAQLQAMGQLYGTTPYGLFSGQSINTNGTQVGTNTTTQSPSLFQTMLGMGQMAANAYQAGRG